MKPEIPTDTPENVLEALRNSLLQWARWGCRGFDCSAATIARLSALPKAYQQHRGHRQQHQQGPAQQYQDQQQHQQRPAQQHQDQQQHQQQDERVETLEDVRSLLGDCRRCELCRSRTHLVFGEGDPNARLVFVGEAPGQEEDQSGQPFVGAAGQLLTRIIEAMGLNRGQVYICNLIKCRPPDNRNPLPDEIATCRPFLDRQLAALNPEAICALGSFAAQSLLSVTTPISRLRGRFHSYNGIQVMPTFHPAYLLRNPEQKRFVWEDVKKIMALLSIQR